MGKIENLYDDYSDILAEFGKDRINNRFQNFCTAYQEFVVVSHIENDVTLNSFSLLHAVLDYFTDISRLKKFHKIEHTNSFKIVAYEISWLLRRKPIQILKDETEELVYVNEKFVLSYVMSYFTKLVGSDFYDGLRENNKRVIDGYVNSLYYYLKYRNCNSQTLEFALLSLGAGIAATNTELSAELISAFVNN